MSQTMTLAAVERVLIDTPAAQGVAAEAERIGARRVFLLAGTTLRHTTDEVTRIERALGDRHAATWSGMASHSPRADVLAAANAARDAKADLIVTVGGGSCTDAGKIVSVLLHQDVRSVDGIDALSLQPDANGKIVNPLKVGPDIPVVCVPTTLSAGEFNPASGATNEQTGQKLGIMHRDMAPVAVILDPAITLHTPEWLWLASGLRAIDHGAETLASARSNAFTDHLATGALGLLSQGLPRVKAWPEDMEARLQCQLGTWQSIIPGIGGVPMGASHAIGHVLGSHCKVPHGYTSCVMLPHVFAWNLPHNGDRQKLVSRAMGVGDAPAPDVLQAFVRSLDLPGTLSEVGVDRSRFASIAKLSIERIAHYANPRPIRSEADVMEILELAA